MKRFLSYILLSIAIVLSLGQAITYAQSDFIPTPIPKPETLPGPDLTDFETGDPRVFGERVLPNLAIGLIGFVGSAALLFLIIGGVRFSTAYGNEEAVEKAKNQIIYSLVGFLLALLAFTIVTILVNIDLGDQDTTTESIGEITDRSSEEEDE